MASPARLNLISYYANFIILALVGLVVNPLLLGFLGPSAFGIFKASQRFYDVATSADGGAPQALKWIVAHRSGTADDDSNRRDLGAALLVWLIWLPVMVAVTAVVTLTLPFTINDIAAEEIPVAQLNGVILSGNVLLTGLLSLPASVLIGVNKGYWAIGTSTVCLVLGNAGMVVAAQMGTGIVGIAAVTLFTTVVVGLGTWWLARRNVSWWGVARPTRENVEHIARFSGWVLAWSYVQRVLLSNELILLSVLVGAVAVANYAFTSYVYQFALAAAVLSTSAFMPQLGKAIGRLDMVEAVGIARRVREVTLALATVAASGAILLNRDFVSLWAGKSSYMGDAANAALALAFVQLALLRCDAQILDAGLSVKRRAIIGVISTAVGLATGAASFLLTKDVTLMIVGMVAGRLVSSVAFPAEVATLVPGSAIGARPYLVALACLAASFLVSQHLPTLDWIGTVGVGLLGGSVVAVAAYALILSDSSRSGLKLNARRGA